MNLVVILAVLRTKYGQLKSLGTVGCAGEIEDVNAAVGAALEKQKGVLAARDKAVGQAREARHLSSEARAAAAEAELARAHVTQEGEALAVAEEKAAQV